MNNRKKLDFLETELEKMIRHFSKGREGDKNKAFGLKVFSVLFAALLTALLGLKVNGELSSLFQNMALVLGAAITVLNAVEVFYDHRSLWIRQTVTLSNLLTLQTDLKFYVMGLDDSELKETVLRGFFDKYQAILGDDLKAWLKLRETASPPTSNATPPIVAGSTNESMQLDAHPHADAKTAPDDSVAP